VRLEIVELIDMGPLPSSREAADDVIRLETYQRLIEAIEPPVTDDEAVALAGLFGPDECFGLAWALVHLIESAPGWPLLDRVPPDSSEWRLLLRSRAERGAES
jgi:hypothetical protein